MGIKTYTDAAQAARDNLIPELDKATEEAQERLNNAVKCTSKEITQKALIRLLERVKSPLPDSINGILTTYTALLNNPGTRDGVYLIRHLASTVKHHGLTHPQAAQIAGAIIGSVRGEAPASLIQWPDADTWHSHLTLAHMEEWAEWLAPEDYKTLQSKRKHATGNRIEAEKDLMQLKQARQALADLVPEKANRKSVCIRNNSEHGQGVAGLRWGAGETREIAVDEYARIVDTQGFNKLLDSGQMEMVA